MKDEIQKQLDEHRAAEVVKVPGILPSGRVVYKYLRLTKSLREVMGF